MIPLGGRKNIMWVLIGLMKNTAHERKAGIIFFHISRYIIF